MSSSNDTNMSLVVVLSVTGLAFTIHHTWQFDRCRCLIPRRKDWFRVLLTWMLVMSNIGMLIWGAGWTYVKYKLGWVNVPGYGPMPVPSELWTEHYKHFNIPLTLWVDVAFCMQVSLNAEEGLYWWHLMRAVRQPKSAKAWLTSSFFFSWIFITILTVAAQCGVTWVKESNMTVQMARMFTVAGAIELVVVFSASIVILKFPGFLKDVKSSGAGAEVRARLHFYHEANKVRTFFRVMFTVSILLLGVDGLTDKKRINLNHIASDMIQQIAFGSYFFASIVSVMLYLPRNWGNASAPPSGRVMVGAGPNLSPPQQIASHALMSLLREGGQWDETDDFLAKQGKTISRAFEAAYKEGWEEAAISPHTPRALENWTSPFGLQTEEGIPSHLRIRIQQEVHSEAPLTAA